MYDIFFNIFYGTVMGICVLMLIFLSLSLLIIIIDKLYKATLRYKVFTDIAEVCDKEYKEEYTTTSTSMVGKVLIPHTHHHASQFNVYVIYEDKKYCINSGKMYGEVNIGEKVEVIVNKGYNKKGKLKDIYLEKLR